MENCFDTISHETLLNIMSRQISDKRLLKLIRELLKAGYLEKWQYHKTYSGTPQGSGLSPLLANVFLNELDQYVQQQLMPRYTQGKTRKWNPEYRRLGNNIAYAKKRGNRQRYKQLYKQRSQIPSMETHDPDFRRLRYVRYADDLLLGFIGPKVEAIEIKAKLARFLQTIKLTLSTEKSLITHANKDRARFLNYEIAIAQDNNQYNPKQNQAQVKRRSINGRPIFRVPRDVIKAWCQRDTRKGKTVHRPGLLACSDYEIIKTYGMQLQGLVNYYQYAHNVSHWYTVKYHLMLSLTKTIAAKHKRPTTWVYKKYKQLSPEGMTAIIVQIPNPNNPDKPLCAQFGNKPIRRQQSRIIIDEITSLYPARTELVSRLLANTCELCGSTEKIRVHHVRQLKDIQRKYRGRPEPPAWAKFMMARHRKTVVVCHQCHTAIHAGKYDGRKVK